MKGLIEAISLSLEGLERQSQIARDMILSRQAGERKPFKASLAAFLEGVEGSLLERFGGEGPADPLAGLRGEVKAFVASGGGAAGGRSTDLGARILKALESDDEAGPAWLIAVRFSSALPDRDTMDSTYLNDRQLPQWLYLRRGDQDENAPSNRMRIGRGCGGAGRSPEPT